MSTAFAEAFVCQSLKATEQPALGKGDWSPGWAYIGLAELKSTSRARRGGAHPVELAAGVSFLKELRVIEEWRASRGRLRKAGGPSGAVEDRGARPTVEVLPGRPHRGIRRAAARRVRADSGWRLCRDAAGP